MFGVTNFDLNQIQEMKTVILILNSRFLWQKNQFDGFWSVKAETAAMGLGRVYILLGPTFRAENSNTTRHLAEFWMVEPEVAFNNGGQYRFG